MSTNKLEKHDMAVVGKIIPWVNVKNCICDECGGRDFCFLIKGQWLCMICRGRKYEKKNKSGGD